MRLSNKKKLEWTAHYIDDSYRNYFSCTVPVSISIKDNANCKFEPYKNEKFPNDYFVTFEESMEN
jgi:hypothetical protein